MQSVLKLTSRLSGSLSPHIASVLERTPTLSEAAAVLANQRISDPMVWSEVFSLAEHSPVTERSEISLLALNIGKFYHSRILRSLTEDFSAFASSSEVVSVLRVVERLPIQKTKGVFLRASEKLQTMEISSVSEIAAVVHAFRRSGDERLFAHVLKKVGKKISMAEISDCVSLLEAMGRAKLRELRTVHALIDRVLRESEISRENFRLHVRMLNAMEKLKIIYGRDRLLGNYSAEISDSSELEISDRLEIIAAFNNLGADTRKFLRFAISDQLQISELPETITTLRALCPSSSASPSLGSDEEISDLIERVISGTREASVRKECAEIFLGNFARTENSLERWTASSLALLRDSINAVMEAAPSAEHVCAQRLRNSVEATVSSLVDQKELAPTFPLLGALATVKIGKGSGLNKRRKKKNEKIE